jgi:hypothetical protein
MEGEGVPWEKFIEGDKRIIERADGIVMMPRWRESKGAVREWEFAMSQKMPIFYWAADESREDLFQWGLDHVEG